MSKPSESLQRELSFKVFKILNGCPLDCAHYVLKFLDFKIVLQCFCLFWWLFYLMLQCEAVELPMGLEHLIFCYFFFRVSLECLDGLGLHQTCMWWSLPPSLDQITLFLFNQIEVLLEPLWGFSSPLKAPHCIAFTIQRARTSYHSSHELHSQKVWNNMSSRYLKV